MAASFQQAVDVIVTKAVRAAEKPKRLAVAGGVAFNSRLREMLTKECEERGDRTVLPVAGVLHRQRGDDRLRGIL